MNQPKQDSFVGAVLRALVREIPPAIPRDFTVEFLQGVQDMLVARFTPPALAPNVASIKLSVMDGDGTLTELSTVTDPVDVQVVGPTILYFGTAIGTNGVESDPSPVVSADLPPQPGVKPDPPGDFTLQFVDGGLTAANPRAAKVAVDRAGFGDVLKAGHALEAKGFDPSTIIAILQQFFPQVPAFVWALIAMIFKPKPTPVPVPQV